MPSISLQEWNNTRAARLDEIEHAHARVGGTGPGRRYATQQINQAYAVLLSSQFQGFCRDLHSESLDHIVRAVRPVALQTALRAEFVFRRTLDTGNPNPGNIGSDFNRFGLLFWSEVRGHDTRNEQRQKALGELNEWRNAIAHQDFDPAKLGGTTTLQLSQVREWRGAVSGLARSFDVTLSRYIATLVGAAPW